MIERLDWESEMGADLAYLRHRAEKGLPTPELDREPTLCESGEWFYSAWSILSTDRQVGMSAGPIPFSAIDRFASRYELDRHEFETLFRVVSRIDAHMRSKAADSKPATDGPPRRAR